MQLKYLALSCLLASTVTPVFATTDGGFENRFYGEGQGQVVWQSGNDFQTEAQLARAGAVGMYATEDFKLKYEVEAQYSNNFKHRGLDDVEVNIARALLISKYGVFVIGNGYSGVYGEVYKRVDIHQSNNGELSSRNNMLWEQGTYATNILAYATPKLDLGFGKLKFVASIVTPKIDNGTNDDIVTARAVFNSKTFNTSVGYVKVNKDFPTTGKDEDYERFSFGADYQWGKLIFAGLVEMTEHAFNKAEDTYVGAITYSMGKFDFGLSHQYKTYKDEWEDDTQSLSIASVNYHYSDTVSFFIEGAYYDTEPSMFDDNYCENSVNIGLNFKI